MSKACASSFVRSAATPARRAKDDAAARMSAMFDAHFTPVWRFLRRLGVPPSDVDDYAQEVMVVAARKLAQIEDGKEYSFLMGVAYRVAADARRTHAHRNETDDDILQEREDPMPDPEALAERRHAREVLDQVLEGMPIEFRAAFVLAEIDGLSMAEIAMALQVPMGTAASRLRRGREYFDGRIKKMMARSAHAEGVA